MHTQADALFSMEKKFGCGDSPRIRGGLRMRDDFGKCYSVG